MRLWLGVCVPCTTQSGVSCGVCHKCRARAEARCVEHCEVQRSPPCAQVGRRGRHEVLCPCAPHSPAQAVAHVCEEREPWGRWSGSHGAREGGGARAAARRSPPLRIAVLCTPSAEFRVRQTCEMGGMNTVRSRREAARWWLCRSSSAPRRGQQTGRSWVSSGAPTCKRQYEAPTSTRQPRWRVAESFAVGGCQHSASSRVGSALVRSFT